MGTNFFGDHLSMGTKCSGDRLSREINFMGIICPGGHEVGNRKSGDQMCRSPFHDIVGGPEKVHKYADVI